LLGGLLASAIGSHLLAASEPLAAADQQYGEETTRQVPIFQQHVVPLLGRLGCNGRNCHGSFQGRGDFRLSLFGYDFQMDHDGLTGQASSASERRIDREDPARSLILRKPTEQIAHEGGARFPVDSWEYRLLHRWIAAGATRGASQELDRLVVEPAELLFQEPGETAQVRVIAEWQNGDREDVTPLCRFKTNADSIATVDRDGNVTSVGQGDTHVIAFYDNGITSLPVMLPRTSVDFRPAEITSTTSPIDRFILAKLNKLRMTPSTRCSDTEFLRPVSIDLTGTLPTPDEVVAFVADQHSDKRIRKINELLDRPSYAAWWTNKLCDFTGCNPRQQAELGQELSVQWYMWIFARLRENTPYDELVRRIVLAQGRQPGQSFDEYTEETSAYFREDAEGSFADRETMPHYWTRRSMEDPARAAEAFAHNFLGVRLQCAQCHKHPFAQWTQRDYKDFSRFFENVAFGVRSEDLDRYRELAKQVGLNVRSKEGAAIRNDAIRQLAGGRVYPWRELYIRDRDVADQVSLLRSGSVTLEGEQDPRRPIMKWMSHPQNPWFAKAFVNRVWATYFHKGIIDPPDDLNPANPASHPQLLEWLTEKFIASGYDIQALHREIVSSETYQRSWKPSANNRDDHHNFSRSIARRLPAEVVYDGFKQAVAGKEHADEVRTDLTRRAIGHLSMRLAGTYAMQVFGKPERAVNCDCERNNQPTLLQAVFLQNDPIIEQRLEYSDWLQSLTEQEQDQEAMPKRELIEEAWLRVLARPPPRTAGHAVNSDPSAPRAPGLKSANIFPNWRGDPTAMPWSAASRTAWPTMGLGTRYVMTGNLPTPVVDYPLYGSVVSKEFSAPPDLPSFVSIERPVEGPGYLGAEYGPLSPGEKPRYGQPFRVRGITLDGTLTVNKFRARHQLASDFDTAFAGYENLDESVRSLDRFSQQAYQIISSPKARNAFDLTREQDREIDRFGRHDFGQSMLLTTRLIEAGVRFVTVLLEGWDTHQDNFNQQGRELLPHLDQSLSAMLDRLGEQGPLDSTAILVTGEFGRTPKVNKNAGRDHWSRAMCSLMAGGSTHAGQVVGATDDKAQGPVGAGYTPDDLAASFFQNIGIDPKTEYRANVGRPITLVRDGSPIPGLLA